MNKRQKKKLEKQAAQPKVSSKALWEQLKHLGGSKRDIYVRITHLAKDGLKEGDVLRLQTNEDGSIYVNDIYKCAQNAADYQEELHWRKQSGSKWYESRGIFDGELVKDGEFEIIWKDGAPV